MAVLGIFCQQDKGNGILFSLVSSERLVGRIGPENFKSDTVMEYYGHLFTDRHIAFASASPHSAKRAKYQPGLHAHPEVDGENAGKAPSKTETQSEPK